MSYTIYDTRAIVADSWPYKDASRRLLVYSQDIGRILVRAQAVRKLDSKLAAAVQRYSESQLELVYGKSGWRLVGAHPHTNFYFTTQNGADAVVRTINLLTHLVPAQQPDRRLYALTINGLFALQSVDTDMLDLVETLFVFRLLAHLGYAPDPSATNLNKFTENITYNQPELESFQSVQNQATTQINHALKSMQL
jgi:recombinational DNA repair protein (RecF pathway)